MHYLQTTFRELSDISIVNSCFLVPVCPVNGPIIFGITFLNREQIPNINGVQNSPHTLYSSLPHTSHQGTFSRVTSIRFRHFVLLDHALIVVTLIKEITEKSVNS